MSTTTLCEVYKSLKALEDSCSYFADFLAGVYGGGFDCNEEVPVDPNVKEDLEFLIAPKLGLMCDRPPDCRIGDGKTAALFSQITERSQSAAVAFDEIVKAANQAETEFLARALPQWPYPE